MEKESDWGLWSLKRFLGSLMRILCLGKESDGGLMKLIWFGESLMGMGILRLGDESDRGLMR